LVRVERQCIILSRMRKSVSISRRTEFAAEFVVGFAAEFAAEFVAEFAVKFAAEYALARGVAVARDPSSPVGPVRPARAWARGVARGAWRPRLGGARIGAWGCCVGVGVRVAPGDA
jgi:hypothetical protein